MDSQKSSAGVKTTQISSNRGERFGVVSKPQLIHVNIGEDIVSKIMNLSQQGPMKICILSAMGGICIVALQESATGSGIATYEVVVSSFIPEKEKPESKGDDDAPKGIRLVDPPATMQAIECTYQGAYTSTPLNNECVVQVGFSYCPFQDISSKVCPMSQIEKLIDFEV